MISRTGIPTEKDLKSIEPPSSRMRRGPVAVIECFQRIPCDPCYPACISGAIKTFRNINDLPMIDWEKCTGCGICIADCPGLAIFVVDQNHSRDKALIKLPYELLPVPEEGEVVLGLDRSGKVVCKAVVEKVTKTKSKTWIISVSVPRKYSMRVRHIRTRR
jgi:Fe-S-cluster-containing hydrogenase component 2